MMDYYTGSQLMSVDEMEWSERRMIMAREISEMCDLLSGFEHDLNDVDNWAVVKKCLMDELGEVRSRIENICGIMGVKS